MKEDRTYDLLRKNMVLTSKDGINLIFDVVVPFAYQGAELKQLKEDISERVSLLDTRYQCVMTMEKGYVAQG